MFSAKVNTAALTQKLHRANRIVQEEIQARVLNEARLLVSSSGNVPGMVQVTPPFSPGVTGTAGRKQGEAKVESDIRKAYGTPSDLWRLIREASNKNVADNFWAYMKLGRWHQANEIALRFTGHGLDVFDGGATHRARRNPRTGRVIGGDHPRNKTIFLAPTQERSLREYIKKKKANVGLLASSLPAAASSKLGKINGVPAWISRHRGAWGRCDIKKTTTSLHVTLGLTARGGADAQRRFGYVLRYRTAAFKRQLPYIKRHALKQARMRLS